MSERIATGDDLERRADYLSQVTELLFPASTDSERARDVGFIAVPNLRRPRVLVPSVSRRIAAAALRRYARPASRSARWKRDAAVAALLSGTDRLLLPDRLKLRRGDDIAAYLGDVLGRRVHLCIHIGPARANRKPILQLLDDDATSLGFAKLGVNELTRGLVRDETAALRTLAGVRLSRLRVPRVLHHGEWAGHAVLVQEALPGWVRPVPHDPIRLTAAMRELAHCLGTSTTTLADSGYAAHLNDRLIRLSRGDDVHAATLASAGRRLLDTHGDHHLTFGAWHGDWAPWNMSLAPSNLLLWDLERFTFGAPMGFDALHHTLQRDIVSRGKDPTTAVLDLLAAAPVILCQFGVDGSRSRITALLYLVDLAARYLADGQAEAGAKLGALGQWLLPTLLRHVAAGEESLS